MKGSELFVKTALAAGVEVCFSNPGTTEMPIVAAFDTLPGIRAVLGLFEGVCTGAADGYGRMTGKPAMTLLHLGPGLANGIANLTNARRAHTPLLNVVGDHASWHRAADAPLTMDVEALTGTVSGWQHTVKSAEEISRYTADGIGAALRGQISSLIAPYDYLLAESQDEEIFEPQFSFDPVDGDAIDAAARLLRRDAKSALILGGRALRRRGLQAAARIRAAAGCELVVETFPAHLERGAGLPVLERIPYASQQAIDLLSQYRGVVLAGAREPVSFFGYDGKSYFLSDEQKRAHIGTDNQDVVKALEHLADALDAPSSVDAGTTLERPELPSGELTAQKACVTLAALQPEHAIIVDEGVSSGFAYFPLAAQAPPHSFLNITSGAIGYGMPCSVGAALACPDRPVIDLQADGSAMYTVQALWTQARESLDITTLICSNRSYKFLQIELARSGSTSLGDSARHLTDLEGPTIDWPRLSQGLGVPGVSVDTVEGLVRELGRALAEAGPHVIEMVLE